MKIVNQILVKLRLPKYWTEPNLNIVWVEKNSIQTQPLY